MSRRESLTTETWGNGVRIGVMPLQDGRIYWYCFDSTTAAADIHTLARESGPWPDPIPAILAATPDDTVMHHEVDYLRTPLPAFVRGSVALLGDAAHAVTPDLGQGACLAIEDAVALANDVTVHGVTEGLRVYDTNRRPRTQSIVRASARMGAAVHGANRPAAVLRDALIRLLPISADSGFSASLYGWQPPQAPKMVTS